MIHIQNEANAVMAPVSLTNAGTAQFTIDRSGFDYLEIDVIWGAFATNGNAPTVCALSELDTTVLSSFVTITGGSAVPLNTTMGESLTKFQVDLRLRKRYIQLNITNGTTTAIVGAVARLVRANQSKDTATTESIQNRNSTSTTAVNSITRL